MATVFQLGARALQSRAGLLAVLALGLPAGCADPVATPADPPAQFITMRRAWLPGERDSTIARIKANHEFNFPYIGDISDQADIIYADTDSVTVVIANPDFGVAAAGPAGLVMAPRFSGTWNITGVDVREVNNNVTPVADTVHWIGVFWSNPAEATWKGFALAAANTNPATVTTAITAVNTTIFDAAFGKAGAGAGETRAANGTTWLGNGGTGTNTIQITVASYGGAGTVTTGPFLGGTAANGSMQGRMRTIDMTRTAGAGTPATFQVDLDFRTAAIGAIRYICIYPSPCTTNTPVAPQRGGAR